MPYQHLTDYRRSVNKRIQFTCYELFYFVFSQRISWLNDDVRSRNFPGLGVGNSHHRDVGNTRMCQNQRLKLCRCNLTSSPHSPLVSLGHSGMCSRTASSRPRPRSPNVLEMSPSSRTALEDLIP